ncbi:MAG: hypothetical protein WAO35_19445 [Terriglobia bacterium]
MEAGIPRLDSLAYPRRRRIITADTALRLPRYFQTNAEFWLNVQNFFDLEVERRSGVTSEFESRVRPAASLVTGSG